MAATDRLIAATLTFMMMRTGPVGEVKACRSGEEIGAR